LIGNIPELGNWDILKAKRLNWNEVHIYINETSKRTISGMLFLTYKKTLNNNSRV
jgi:hypothetical protein